MIVDISEGAPMIGNAVSHYEILEKLGQGGMGVVYKALDSTLDRIVALKFLPPHLTSDPVEKERLYHEARATSCLNHANITTIYEIREHETEVFLAMEYVEGETLKSLALRTVLPLTKALDIAIQIADGLVAAHDKGIVHRDIKSDNIMITPKGQVKIMDFGLARLKGAARLTRAGSTVGTAAYMSPEQAQGEEVDNRSDIFSFGVVLYEIFSGKLPFRGDHEAALLYSVVNEEPIPLARFNETVTQELERIVTKALAKDPQDRYQHMDDILADLRHERKCLDLAAGGYTSAKVTATVAPPVSGTHARVQIPSEELPHAGVPRKRTSQLVFMAVGALLALAFIGVLLFLPISSSPPTPANSKTVAVLPFTNLAGDKEEEYFSDGITEDILTQLARISDINVISRTSVMQYKGTTKSIREIGKELNAGVILEGSVRHAGNEVRIVAQLIDAASDRHLWAETYDREDKQIFVIQSEIAQKIAFALKTRLSPSELEQLKASPEANTTAYSLLLQGRHFVNRRDEESVKKGIGLYERALAVDSNDARVWAALSDAYLTQMTFAQSEIRNPLEKARGAALRAIALDDKLADGHRNLAEVFHVKDWNWQGAYQEYKKALELEPGNALSMNRMSNQLLTHGHLDEAIALNQKAVSLDPLLDRAHMGLCHVLWYANRNREAIASGRKVLELSPHYPATHGMLAYCYIALGQPDSAILEANLEEDEFWRICALAVAYHSAGRKADADQALERLLEVGSRDGPFQIAEAYAFRGESNPAFEWLEIAYRLRDPGLSQIKVDPLLKNIENDHRYQAFMRKMGLHE